MKIITKYPIIYSNGDGQDSILKKELLDSIKSTTTDTGNKKDDQKKSEDKLLDKSLEKSLEKIKKQKAIEKKWDKHNKKIKEYLENKDAKNQQEQTKETGMSTGVKVALIGGGVLILGTIIYLIAKR